MIGQELLAADPGKFDGVLLGLLFAVASGRGVDRICR